MLESLARLGDVGTRIINQSAADTVADLQLLQPILTQLAAAGPDLAGSLDLLLTYPFPASSVIGAGDGGSTPLNYRQDQRTGGYALFTNMTATVELDLTQTLCRYVIDPATGALEQIEPQDVAGDTCGQAGGPPGNQGARPPAGVPRPVARSWACPASPVTSSARSPAPPPRPGCQACPSSREPSRDHAQDQVPADRLRPGGAPRHVLPRLQVRRAGPRASSAAATTSRPTSPTPAASSSTPR